MLWLALHFDRLALDVFERASLSTTDGESLPRAICEQKIIRYPNASARKHGIEAGMPRASALALLPELSLLERDPARENAAQRKLTHWALQFTPAVCLPDAGDAAGLLLEIEASLRLFGGLSALLDRLRSDLTELGYHALIAVAPSAGGAWLLALERDRYLCTTPTELHEALARLPLARLQQARAHLNALESIGARCIGDLLALPRAGLARRFGHALLDEIDRAHGTRVQAHAWLQAPAEFSTRLELLAQVALTEPLLFAAHRIFAELIGWLAARQAAIRSFVFIAIHDQGEDTRIEIRLNEASRELPRLIGLLRERLGAMRLRAPVHTIGLVCTEVLPLAENNGDLFPSPSSARQSLGRLLERLQARLGHEQVRRLHLVADHRPEAAYRITTVERFDFPQATGKQSSQASRYSAEPGILPRPLWLLQEPLRLRERNNQPWWHSPLTLLAGPERIETGWWDQLLVQRDYFIAQDTDQVLYWIFRERANTSAGPPGWFIHGRFG